VLIEIGRNNEEGEEIESIVLGFTVQRALELAGDIHATVSHILDKM